MPAPAPAVAVCEADPSSFAAVRRCIRFTRRRPADFAPHIRSASLCEADAAAPVQRPRSQPFPYSVQRRRVDRPCGNAFVLQDVEGLRALAQEVVPRRGLAKLSFIKGLGEWLVLDDSIAYFLGLARGRWSKQCAREKFAVVFFVEPRVLDHEELEARNKSRERERADCQLRDWFVGPRSVRI